MSVYSGPEIPTSGLVLSLDMANEKSFKGAPTTNYVPNPQASYNGSAFVFGYNYPNLGATYTYRTGVSNPINSPGVLEYYTGTTGYKFFSVDSTAVPSTGTYTFSYYARITTGSSTNVNNQQLWRDSVIGDQAVTGDWNPTFTTEWKRYVTRGPVQAGSALQYFPIHSGSLTGGVTIQYCGFQLESAAFATPFVIGTRANTQAIIDLTSTNTLSANSLTYSSNGIYSFNGTDNFISIPNFSYNPNSTGFTFEAVIKPTTSNSGLSTYRRLLVLDGPTFYGILLEPDSRGIRLDVPGSNGTRYGVSTNYTLTGQTTYHLVWTWINWTNNLYINGNLVLGPTSDGGSGTAGTTGQLNVGGNTTNNYFPGLVNLVNFYNRVLNASEVKTLFYARRGRYGL